MPPVPSDSVNTQAARRRRPGRVPTSCAECRRLKLKCDRKVPCEKCVQRGCPSICPDATLAPRKGNRLVLSTTAELHDRIDILTARIRSLEDGLRSVQETHPLLAPKLLEIKHPPSPDFNHQQAPPEYAPPGHDHNHAHAHTAPVNNDSEPDMTRISDVNGVDSDSAQKAPQENNWKTTKGYEKAMREYEQAKTRTSNCATEFGLSGELLKGQNEYSSQSNGGAETYSQHSPSSSVVDHDSDSVHKENTELEDAFGTLTLGSIGEVNFFGRSARTEYLVRAVSKPPSLSTSHSMQESRLSSRILTATCAEIDEPSNPELISEVCSYLPPLSEAIRLCELYLKHGEYLYKPMDRSDLFDTTVAEVYRAVESPAGPPCHPHSIALLFIIFALGSLFDEDQPAYSIRAHEYYCLARASTTFTSPLRWTTLNSIQTLLYMAQYLELSEGDSMPSSVAWIYIGFATRLGMAVGLHLNCERWNLPTQQLQQRQRLFWELFKIDIHTSFGLGRPPGLTPAYVDCPMPADPGVIGEDGEREIGFHSWASRYTLVLHTVMNTAFATSVPTYHTIVELDRRIRDFQVPSNLRIKCGRLHELSAGKLMQQYTVLGWKESALLNLHRSYFARALKESPNDLLKHKYAASVMATYRSAWRLIEGLKMYWDAPSKTLMRRLSLPWSHAFSATVVMCLLVTRAPTSSLTRSSLETLDNVDRVFRDAASTCRTAANNLESIKKLRAKAHAIFEQRTADESEESAALMLSELDRLGGKTHLLMSLSELPSHHRPQSQSHTSQTSQTTNSSPSIPFADTPSPASSSSPPAYVNNLNPGYAHNLDMIFDQSMFPYPSNPSYYSDDSSMDEGIPNRPHNMHPTIQKDMEVFEAYNPMTQDDTQKLPQITPDQYTNSQNVQATGLEFVDFPIQDPVMVNNPDYNVFQGMGPMYNGVGAGAPIVGMPEEAYAGSYSSAMPDTTWHSFIQQLGFRS